MRPVLLSLALFAAACPVVAKDEVPLRLDGLFQDHMVLPRHGAVVSGHAAPGEEITVSFFNISQLAAADDKGRFQVELPDFQPGKTSRLSVSTGSGDRVEYDDVISGDVYLCSGQSNMQMSVKRALNEDVVISNSANDLIRMATIPVNAQAKPQERFTSQIAWQKAGPDTVGDWSATCYFFAASLQKRVQVPIGLVHASLGGSDITTWLSPDALLPDYAAAQNLLNLYAEDADKAGAEFGHSFEQWWKDKGAPGTPWAATAADLRTWQAAPNVSSNWEKWGLRELASYNGPLWYGAIVTVTAEQAAQGATLELGRVDDIDQTWLNGQPVGFTSGAGTERKYKLPEGALVAGDNVVVLNVVDLWSYGGMYGDAPRQLKLADGTAVPLTGWRWNPVPAGLGNPPRAPWDATGGVSILKNGMIAPMGSFGFAGTVWYQGESNVGRPYQSLMARLFKDWRSQFGDDMVFAVVQLANYENRAVKPVESGWARLREDQRLAVLADGNAVLATAIDIGEATDIHPANKQVLGERLSRAMAIKLYGFNGSVSGPMITSVVKDGDRLVLTFDGMEGDFITYSSNRPIGFEACVGNECRYVDAEASGKTVVLLAAANATKVRFCWADAPTCNLYDGKTGLPAVPFEQAVAP
ncbi:glycosyl hydrolase family 2, sugar binding domain protein [Asticcacaulis biprosthecium C19]|uniref:Glycosyl hydrolase family 2, sugar binding domain protein n=1 Tax=Asticcacaulis biprosthecium C19 TaxID=715226 RepID=F4QN63_9CAUL|nr:sialate O-acetylesterase [Asticcacaulis biprosthecium]EGF91654.1 glycosyl hydrolase family 2, sugar binding domain protein [Asticcacaulis biprosthecium C19]